MIAEFNLWKKQKRKLSETVFFKISLVFLYYSVQTLFNPFQNFRLVQIVTNCRRHLKVHLRWKISTILGRKHCEER